MHPPSDQMDIEPTHTTPIHDHKQRNLKLGEKLPFKCSKCDMEFRRKDYLKRHLRTHTGERPYSCPHCGKLFTRSDNMKHHVEIHFNQSAQQQKQINAITTDLSHQKTKHLPTQMELHPYLQSPPQPHHLMTQPPVNVKWTFYEPKSFQGQFSQGQPNVQNSRLKIDIADLLN